MGLSSKQVYSDGSDWNQTLLQDQLPKPSTGRREQQQNQQQSEPVKCPRCDSTNTKFCYYNNYNKSQPRHFCKSCKRHWTKGGTLRNVPIGGGRKNKRLKSSKNSTIASAAATATTTKTTVSTISTTTINTNIINRVNPHMTIQAQQQKHNLPLRIAYSDKTTASETLRQALVSPPSSVLQQNSISCSNFVSKNFNIGSQSALLSPAASLPQGLNFLHSNLSSFDTNPSSISTSFQFPNVHSYSAGKTMEDSIVTSIMPDMTSSSVSQHLELWQVPNESRGIDMTSYWNWDDIDNFVSTTNLNLPWDDSELKP